MRSPMNPVDPVRRTREASSSDDSGGMSRMSKNVIAVGCGDLSERVEVCERYEVDCERSC